MLGRRRTFNYSPTYTNPFFRKRKKIRRISIKIKLLILAIIFGLGSLIWFLFFSYFFNIKSIEVGGNRLIPQESLKETGWIIAGGKNIFLLDDDDINANLKESYKSIQEIKIIKKFPETLKIKIKESDSVALWEENGKYFFVDSQGNIIYETSLEAAKGLPIIENRGGISIAEKSMGESQKIPFLLKLQPALNEKNIEIEKFYIDNEEMNVKAKTKIGPILIFGIKDEDLSKQIEKFIIYKDQIKDEIKNEQYIDLRFANIIYSK